MADQGQAAGWKRDPTGRFFGRYWDGAVWTDQVVTADRQQDVDLFAPAPVQAVPAPPAPAVRDEQRQGAYLILGGAAAVAIGCFLPWATLTAPFVGTISKAGIEGDGVFFLGLAAVMAAVAFAFARQVPASIPVRRWSLAALIVVLALFTAFEVTDMASRFADAADEGLPVSTSYGAGLWLVGFGVVAAAAGWVRMPWAQMQWRAESPRPGP